MTEYSLWTNRESAGDARLHPLFAAAAILCYAAVVVALFGDFTLNHIPGAAVIRLAIGFCLLLLIARWLDRVEAKHLGKRSRASPAMPRSQRPTRVAPRSILRDLTLHSDSRSEPAPIESGATVSLRGLRKLRDAMWARRAQLHNDGCDLAS